MKKIVFKKEARDKLLEGAKIMYDAVGSTLSPKGRNVGITRQWGPPIVVHDGVTVAREVEHKDEYVNAGIQLIREAASKTNDEAGDGTTTSTILAYELIRRGKDMVENGINPMILRRQMEEALPSLIKKLEEITKPVKNNEDIKRVAFISSAHEDIATATAEAIEKVGKSGLVTVEEGGTKTDVRYTDGMEIDKGYAAPHFITSIRRMESIIEEPVVAVLGKKISMASEIGPLLEVMAAIKKDIFIIGDVQGDALNSVVVNKMKAIINAVVVPPPGSGDTRKHALEDIALITGGTVISDELGLEMSQFQNQFDRNWLGMAKMVVSSRRSTTVVKLEEKDVTEEAHKKDIKDRDRRIAERIKQLEDVIKKNESPYETEKAQQRLARLTTGVAVVRVESKTQAATRERVELAKDAVSAARAAYDEGIVPGAGVAFIQIAQVLQRKNDGEKLLFDVLHTITDKILDNAGEDKKKKDAIISDIENKGGNNGYNVNTGEVEDLIQAGIIDPSKVIRLSLENAMEVAGSVLSTDTLIVDEREDTKTQMQMA